MHELFINSDQITTPARGKLFRLCRDINYVAINSVTGFLLSSIVVVVVVFERPFVKGSPYAIGPLSVCHILAVCPVRNVGVLWPKGWTDQDEKRIKMKLGMLVGLVPGYIVRCGPRFPPPKGHSPPIFGLYLLGPNVSTDQNATW